VQCSQLCPCSTRTQYISVFSHERVSRIQSAVYVSIIKNFYVRVGTPGFVCYSLLRGGAGWHNPRRLWQCSEDYQNIIPLNPELNPICYLLSLLAHHFLHVSRIRVKSLTIRLLMSYIYGTPILDVSRSYTTTHHSR